MRKLLTAAALLTTLIAPANACDPEAFCYGVLSIKDGWMMVGKESFCRFNLKSSGAKYVLKFCKVGAVCSTDISIVADEAITCYATRDISKIPPSQRRSYKNERWHVETGR